MKGAIVLETLRVYVFDLVADQTADEQKYLELGISHETDEHENRRKLPSFRVWYPLSPKSLADLETMGVTSRKVNDWTTSTTHDPDHVFLIDLVSVPCSDEETHGTEANRLFVRNPRKA